MRYKHNHDLCLVVIFSFVLFLERRLGSLSTAQAA